ncbi:hypothetical protein [Streptomyces sp. NPDC051776]|uniref:hypothetical protein n=1 Tax=Streptomyces sp. NPDC051776 TaxID=3155414 RepID=UPI003434EFEE
MMRGRKVTTATSVVAMALGGLASLGSTTAFADGPSANARGGSATAGQVFQQSTAQESKQNNNCSQPNALDEVFSLSGSRLDGECRTGNGSFNYGSVVKKGAADVNGGSATTGLVQQNAAQRGGQNNHCGQANLTDLTVTGGRHAVRCADWDDSFNRFTRYEGGGVETNGGSGGVADAVEQNTAQEGRQNTSCADFNATVIDVSGGRLEGFCGNKDRSFNENAVVKGGGARVNGGSASAGLNQQNVGQEGRQNANCANANSTSITLSGGRLEGRCKHVDGSLNRKTFVKGKGAEVDGGSSAMSAAEQNVAQEGRQNSHCANANATNLTVTGVSGKVHCTAVDRSGSVGTAEFSGGAEASGSSSAMDLFQQNLAQEGRQNLDCANANNATITLSSSRDTTKCVAVDNSKKLGWFHK